MARRIEPVKVPTRKRDVPRDDDQGNYEMDRLIQLQNVKGPQKAREKVVNFKDQGKAAAPGEEEDLQFELKNKQTIAEEILLEGFPQSYIDFFYITSGTIPEVIEPSEQYREEYEKTRMRKKAYGDNNKQEELINLKETLITAEGDLPHDKTNPFHDYQRLARLFFDDPVNDYQVAAYFYKRCISIAKSIPDARLECQALTGFGKCYAQLGRLDRAIETYENILKKAQQNSLESVKSDVSKELIDIYSKMSANYDNKEDEESINMGLHYLQKCLDAAETGKDDEKKAEICYKMGNIHFKKHNYEKALEYHLKNHQIALSKNDGQKESNQQTDKLINALAALSKTYIALNRIQDALKTLDEYLKQSKRGRLNAHADAAYHLARVYSMNGNTAKSIDSYQLHFDSAKNERTHKQRKLIDKARVYLGLAKANANIDWKAKKDK